LLRPLQPRLYSISSSPRLHPHSIHLTTAVVSFDCLGRRRKGVCSAFLADRVRVGWTVPVYVHSNPAFRPPADPNTPLIMVGPGTGIAPFRAFLQQREAQGAHGRNWLFFGDQHQATDFLYREEIERWQTCRLLTRLSTAFSRDQTDKVYVQTRMLEAAKDLFDWLEDGAAFYVCGDAARMARDVDAALRTLIEHAGGRTREQADNYVEALRTAGRYRRDVY
jgi:sulfite reductase (NADPH) flavoprotein alpha-component